MNLWIPRLPRRIPQMPAGIFVEARFAGRGGDWAMLGGGPHRGGGALSSDANSGNELSGFQSEDPSAWARVSPRRRFSASQRRICSTLTGPYSFPSAPTILYITRLFA